MKAIRHENKIESFGKPDAQLTDDSMKHLLALSGNVAVGKTTLGARLAERLQANWLPETELSDQFAHLIATDTPRAKLLTEITFAALRAGVLASRFLGGAQIIVAERSLWDDWIFFQAWRGRYELAEHNEFMLRLFQHIAPEASEYAVHTVMLASGTEPLSSRARRRNKPYDHIFTREVIDDIERQYADALEHQPGHVVGVVDVSDLDIADAAQVDVVLSKLEAIFTPFISSTNVQAA